MTISFNLIGQHGRLGNQMFQYAALRGIASKHGYDFSIPPSDCADPWREHQLFQGFELFGLKAENVKVNDCALKIEAVHFHFISTLLDACPDQADIFGHFQSEKYFAHIASEIKSDFTFKAPILAKAKALRQHLHGSPVVSLHVRRGDYLQYPGPPCCPIEYYENALARLDPALAVLVFTDDPTWVKSQPLFQSARFHLSMDNSNLVDLCLMSLCDYHIIANSSFSWWGAWLANSRQTFAPHTWFPSHYEQHLNAVDLIPDRWIKL